MAARPLIKESLLLLYPSGVDPRTNNVFSNLRFALSVILISMMCIESLLDCIYNWRGLDSMESVVIFAGIFQVLTKSCILVIYRENLAEVMNKMNQFWPINKYGSELQNEIESIYTFGRKCMKYTVVFLIFGTLVFYSGSIFGRTRKLPLAAYYPTDLNRSPDYEIAFGLEILVTFFAQFNLVGFDFLFISLIINTTCELKMVKKGFGNIPINPKSKSGNKDSLREIYKIIEHHNLILECTKSIRGIYSFWLLNIYFYNIIDLCASLLRMIATGFPPSLQSLSSYGFVTVFYLIQLYFYCAAGQYLITESESISATVYNIDWWIKTQPELRRALALVIQRANKPEQLTAGGMFVLNLSGFRKVTRSALSFFTIVNALYKEN